MLILKDIKKDYKIGENVTHALKGVSLEFRRNEFVAILGPSGCGKTTLLNIIGGLDDYTSGNLIINHRSTRNFSSYDWDSYRNNSIGFVFQSYNLIMHQSVFSNVELALTLCGMKRAERKERVMEALAKVDLKGEEKKRPNQLSGGQMQRVAIARALVNNPDIVLADEPTGALDGETSIQIMELLSEVAKDRLVIMVTHNPELAEKYATRIIKVADGQVIDDSAPYTENWDIPETENLEKTNKAKNLAQSFKNWWNPGLGDVTASPEEIEAQKQKQAEAKAKAKAERKIAKKEKTSMSFLSALRLSLSNIVTKKVRTILTAIAGSIGIIGIALVLSLSTGVGNFLTKTEEDSLSKYPITIQDKSINLTAVLGLLQDKGSDSAESHPDTGEIKVQKVMGNVLTNLDMIFGENDLESFKQFCDTKITNDLGSVKYGYNTTFNIYSNNGYTVSGKTTTKDDDYFIVNPFYEAMTSMLEKMPIPGLSDQLSTVQSYMDMFSTWDELVANPELLNQQYELLGNSRWPEKSNELILVVDEYNQIPDYVMFTLGLRSPSLADIMSILGGNDTAWDNVELNVESMVGLKYKLLANSDFYEKNGDRYEAIDKVEASNEFIEQYGEDLEIVGVVRLKEGVTSGAINGNIAYPASLNEFMLKKIENSEVVKAQRNSPKVDVVTGKSISSEERLQEVLEDLGCANLDKPSSIMIYANSFESKDTIKKLIEEYNNAADAEMQQAVAGGEKNAKSKAIKYTDTLDLIMGYVETLTTTITGVLVGFSAISLIVSSIMIGIITYTSVLERTKEIGVLRSLGARKKDISRVFLAETTMIGALSGIIGITFTYIMTFPINAILQKMFNIGGLAELTWIPCVALFAISIILSDIAGLVPSKIASKKDPVVALRSE